MGTKPADTYYSVRTEKLELNKSAGILCIVIMLLTQICILFLIWTCMGMESDQIYKIGSQETNGLPIDFLYNGELRLRGMLGVSLTSAVGDGTVVDCAPGNPMIQCRAYGDYANVTVTDEANFCARVEWTSTYARRLEDCYNVGTDDYIYGASGENFQYWPINEDVKNESAYITGGRFGCVIENYWLFSKGASVHVDEENPLFVSWDTVRPGQLCFVSKDEYPYTERPVLSLSYSVCVGQNVKTVHQDHFLSFYKAPPAIPDETMLIYPFWSTWAQFKRDVNQSIVVDYAEQIVNRGFESSHIQIDDNWETCYGEGEFDPVKFPDPASMVAQVKSLNLRITLWFHPFINFGCDLFKTALELNHLVKDGKGKTSLSSWWVPGGENTGLVDVTNEAALEWWVERVNRLSLYGIDGFKFDAGEISWLPYSMKLEGDQDMAPNSYTTMFIEAISRFGTLVEARVARLNQEQTIFMRMNDKRSRWGYNVGLRSMIPTALQFGIIGYPFVLPDMVGGNAYDEGWPSKELYIRWLQVNVFMPAIQFSIVPWDEHFDDETVEITKKILSIREQYKEEIMDAARQAVIDGSPINRPIWWVDPTDPQTFTIDQAYMLGDKILVAPVVDEGATARDIYLPSGIWVSGVTNITHVGGTWLRNYYAPLDIVPYFIKV